MVRPRSRRSHSENALFDAVLDSRLQALADLVPFKVGDLPGYVGALFDYFVAHPGTPTGAESAARLKRNRASVVRDLLG